MSNAHLMTPSSWFRLAMLSPLGLRWGAVSLAVLLTLLFQVLSPDAWVQLDERSDSLTWRMADAQQQERRVVVVDIDEKSVHALGPWPWNRETQARLVEGLNHYQVGLKLFDVVLPDAKPGDARLKTALQSGAPNVWGQVFSLNPDITVRQGALSGGLSLGACPTIAAQAYGFIGNQPELLQANASAGHITPIIDADGVVRRVPALVCLDGRAYPTLALAGLQALSGGPLVIRRGEHLADAPWRITLSNLPGVSLPLNDQGQIRVSYRLPRAGFVSVSAVDVIERRLPPQMMQGVWTLVGSTAFGVGDAIPTPQGGSVAGVEVHAQMLAAALDARTPYTPLLAGMVSIVLALLALSVLVACNFAGESGAAAGAPLAGNRSKMHPRHWLVLALPVVGLALGAGLFAVHAIALLQFQVWLGWSQSAFVVVLAGVLLSVAELTRLRWQKNRLYDNLASYLSEPVAREIAWAERSAAIEASRREVVVLSASLRNFGAFCESQPAEAAARVLHEFLSVANQVVHDNGGVLHHVRGADVLAVWPSVAAAPAPAPAPTAALAAAAALWRACDELCSKWQPSPAPASASAAQDYAAWLELAVGLEQGSVLAGSLGPPDRRVHAVLGEPVQVAHALQEMTEELSYPILLGPNLYAQLATATQGAIPHPSISRLGEFLLPGTASPRIIYAAVVEYNVARLRLIVGQGEQRLTA